VKHASPESLISISELLKEIQAIPELKEKTTGVFTLRSKPLLHFHEDPAGMFAYLRDPIEGWIRLSVNTDGERDDLLARLICIAR
jgi:hypothetical protein